MENFKKKIIIILERLIEKLKSCPDNKQVSNFQKLTPIDDADLTGYEEALDHAFKKEDKIKNIAITGSYGSGKSSILNTYKKNSKLKFIHISFLHFKECDKKDVNVCENKEEDKARENNTKTEIDLECEKENVNKIDKDKIREAVLERKIINHIINQIPFKYISDTNFNVRGNIGIVKSVTKILFGIAILYLILFFNDDQLNKLFKLLKLIKFIPTKLNQDKISTYILLCCFIYIVIYLIILFKKLRWKNILKKLNFKNIELDLDKLSNDHNKYDSFFDIYLNEILYVFENCKKDVIVFEDIDRLEMSVVFERLREINILLNEILKKKNKVIKFCYLMRDDIFNSEDRVKFFDFIIPVVSIMNGFNSYDKILEYLGKEKILSKKGNVSFENKKFIDMVSKDLLKNISQYITNIRLLKNIYNEFIIYNNVLNNDRNLELNYDKILSIIVYKNLFPKDFNNLHYNKGFLFYLFKDKYVKNELISELEQELSKLENKFENEINDLLVMMKKYINDMEINNEISNRKFLINSLGNENIIAYIYHYLEEIYIKRLRFKFESADDVDKAKYNYITYIFFKEYGFKKIYYDRFEFIFKRHLLFNYNEEDESYILLSKLGDLKIEIFQKKYEIEFLKYERYRVIPKVILNKLIEKALYKIYGEDKLNENIENIDLIKYIVLNDYIDEDYEEYATYFYPINISKNDKEFLSIIYSGNGIDFDYALNNPELVIDKIPLSYWNSTCVLNFDILDYLLMLFFEKNDTEKFKNKRQYLILSFKNSQKSTNNYSIFFQFLVRYFHRNIVNDKDYMNQNFLILLSQLNIECKFFLVIDESFKKYLSKEFFENIDKYTLYYINKENLEVILKEVYDKNLDDIKKQGYKIIYNMKNSNLYKYIHKNMYNMCAYLRCYHKLHTKVSSKESNQIVELLNICYKKMKYMNDKSISDNEIQIVLKEYIQKLRVKIIFVENIEDKNIQKFIFDYNKAKYNEENIFQYFIINRTTGIANFINNNDKKYKLNFSKIISKYNRKDLLRFLRYIVKSNEINNEKYREIISSMVMIKNEFKDEFKKYILDNISEINVEKQEILTDIGLYKKD